MKYLPEPNKERWVDFKEPRVEKCFTARELLTSDHKLEELVDEIKEIIING